MNVSCASEFELAWLEPVLSLGDEHACGLLAVRGILGSYACGVRNNYFSFCDATWLQNLRCVDRHFFCRPGMGCKHVWPLRGFGWGHWQVWASMKTNIILRILHCIWSNMCVKLRYKSIPAVVLSPYSICIG